VIAPSWWVGATREQMAERSRERQRARNATMRAYGRRDKDNA